MARRLRIPVRWLRAEAEAGRVPHVRAGSGAAVRPRNGWRVLLKRSKRKGASREKAQSRCGVRWPRLNRADELLLMREACRRLGWERNAGPREENRAADDPVRSVRLRDRPVDPRFLRQVLQDNRPAGRDGIGLPPGFTIIDDNAVLDRLPMIPLPAVKVLLALRGEPSRARRAGHQSTVSLGTPACACTGRRASPIWLD